MSSEIIVVHGRGTITPSQELWTPEHREELTPYEDTAVQYLIDSQSGSAGAAVTSTLAGATGQTVYITGFHVTAGLVIANVAGAVFVGPVLDASGTQKTLAYVVQFVTAGGVIFVVNFPEPLPAPAGTSIAAAIGAITGGPAVGIMIFGVRTSS